MTASPILVIGGGPAGMEASRGIAEIGYKAIVVEKRSIALQLGDDFVKAFGGELLLELRHERRVFVHARTPVDSQPAAVLDLRDLGTELRGEFRHARVLRIDSLHRTGQQDVDAALDQSDDHEGGGPKYRDRDLHHDSSRRTSSRPTMLARLARPTTSTNGSGASCCRS